MEIKYSKGMLSGSGVIYLEVEVEEGTTEYFNITQSELESGWKNGGNNTSHIQRKFQIKKAYNTIKNCQNKKIKLTKK